jgi:hypothetical protein
MAFSGCCGRVGFNRGWQAAESLDLIETQIFLPEQGA